MNENESKASDIMIIKLIFTLLNKLCLNRLELKKLAIITLKISEQISAADSISFTESLIQALSLQVITQSAIRQAISCESIDSLLEFLSTLDRNSVTLDKNSDFIFNKNSDSKSSCLSESASHNSADETTDKFSEAQTQS